MEGACTQESDDNYETLCIFVTRVVDLRRPKVATATTLLCWPETGPGCADGVSSILKPAYKYGITFHHGGGRAAGAGKLQPTYLSTRSWSPPAGGRDCVLVPESAVLWKAGSVPSRKVWKQSPDLDNPPPGKLLHGPLEGRGGVYMTYKLVTVSTLA